MLRVRFVTWDGFNALKKKEESQKYNNTTRSTIAYDHFYKVFFYYLYKYLDSSIHLLFIQSQTSVHSTLGQFCSSIIHQLHQFQFLSFFSPNYHHKIIILFLILERSDSLNSIQHPLSNSLL